MRCTEEGGVKFGPSMSARQPHSHCHFCGAAYTDLSSYPRTCPACGEMFWSNPIPVAVVAVKMETGVLIIQRGIEPAKGHWALPGGFLETGETWQQGACREVLEETGFQCEKMILVGSQSPNPASHNNRLWTYVATNCVQVQEQQLDPYEEIEVFTAPFEEFETMIDQGKVGHALVLSSMRLARPVLEKLGL